MKLREIVVDFPDYLFIADSDGRVIEQPEFYFREIGVLRRLGRSLSRKQRGSRNRRKAKYRLAKWHEHIRNRRAYFLWQVARFYAGNYERVVVPKLPLSRKIEYAMTSRAAMRLCDAGYGLFVSMLRHKCKEFGTELVERKDEELWESNEKKAREIAEIEKIRKMVWQSRKIMKSANKKALQSLKEASEQVRTLRI